MSEYRRSVNFDDDDDDDVDDVVIKRISNGSKLNQAVYRLLFLTA